MVLACLCGQGDSSRLLDAAKHGDVQAAVSAIQRKPKAAHAQQWGGETAWHLAAKEGHTAVLQAMADAIRSLPALQLKQLSRFGSSADEIITRLAQEEDAKSLTPLHLACIKGRAAAAGVLMSFGVNPFAMDSVGRTPLHYAASWGHADCINAVLSAHSGTPKPDWGVAWPNDEDTRLVDVQNMAGFTPLHYAVWVGRKEAIQALASYDASINVTNISHDYDWIKVGSGNTPLHLAAFGGDFDVVKLLLAAHVQTLSAGAEVMAAARGQWGERHADDVRHTRNRRGLMAYHIAVHKGFQHLTELLHPDIPYTFIFSNDDMEVGSVRMYGPARLMVIAAKALQQKLVNELAAVAAAAAAAAEGGPATTAPAAAIGDKPSAAAGGAAASVMVVAAGGSGSCSGSGAVDQAVAAVGRQQQQQQLSERQVQEARDAAANSAMPAAGTADAAGAAAPRGSTQVPEVLSPFAARSHKLWTSSTPSDAASLASATPATATPAGSNAAAALSYPSLQAAVIAAVGRSRFGAAAAADAADDTATLTAAAAAAADDDASIDSAFAVQGAPAGPECEQQEPSFVSAALLQKPEEALSPSATAPAALLTAPAQQQQQQQQGVGEDSSFVGFAQLQTAAGAAAATPTAAAAAADSSVSSGVSSPFGKSLQQQQQQQQLVSSGASDAGLSAISSSTVPGSNSAVAGTPANSIIVSEYLASGSVRGAGFSSSGKTAAPASPGVSSASLPAAEQRAAFFASLDGRPGGARLSSSISRERLAEESVLHWLPGSSSLPLAAHTAAAAGSGAGAGGGQMNSDAVVGSGRSAAVGSAAGGSSAGASRLVQRALGSSSGGDKHRHRRAHSVAVLDSAADRERRLLGRQGSRAGGAAENRRATADSYDQQQQQQQGRSSWLKPMDSLRRVSSRKMLLDDVLPPSTIMTTAADGDDSSSHQQPHPQQQQQQPAGRHLVNSVSNLTSSSRLSMGSAPGVARSSLDQLQLAAPAPDLDPTQQQQQLLQQQDGGSAHGSAAAAAAAAQQDTDCVADNPLDVMLTIRAGRIGGNAEAMRQQLLMMKLASGRNNFDTQVSAFAASMQLLPDPAGLDAVNSGSAAGMRVASVTLAAPARRGSVAGQGRAAKLAAAQRAASVPLDTQLDAAADAATAAVGMSSAPGGSEVPPAAAANGAVSRGEAADPADSMHSQAGDANSAAAVAGYGQPQAFRKSLSMASIRNNSSMHRSLIMRQPSLQRLLSGGSRSHLGSRMSDDQSATSDVRSLPGGAAAATGLDSSARNGSTSGSGVLPAAAAVWSNAGQTGVLQQLPGVTANGDLPIIQQQPASQLLGSSAAYASGLLGSTHGGVVSDMITEEGEDEGSDDDELTCEICFDAAAVVSLQACGHALCVGCCREMTKLHHFKPALCPFCRQIICGFTARVD
uniref:RING-type domain-containing protein n=1 Tax=Tetradesmus obliquus TaxID=3088 RepID=A0A383W9G5_TETOB|eukprot:jgi/Sobl393_1/8862/SZX73336.1